ncbi:MAG: alpha/beta hydrolase, partial [Nitrospirota bacterium]
MSACTQAAFTTANLPTHLVEMAVEHDRAYGSELLQKLDVYIPANTMEKQLDVLVFFYGGRWTYGAKEDYRFVAATFVKEGFVV